MNPDEFLYLKGICFFVGGFCEDPSPSSGIEYLEKAAIMGNKRAMEILSISSNSSYEVYLDAFKLGIAPFSSRTYNQILLSIEAHARLSDKQEKKLLLAYNNFKKKPCQIQMDKDLMFEIAIRYYVGDITGKKSIVKGERWLDKAKAAGHVEAKRISLSPNTVQWAYVDAGELYGSVRAIKKVTEWHKSHQLKVLDQDLIEFAKAVVAQGDIY